MKAEKKKIIFAIGELLAIAAILFGLWLIIEHSTHHLEDHAECEVCSIASILTVFIAIAFVFILEITTRLYIKFMSVSSRPVLNYSIIRAPPVYLLSR